MVKPKQAPLWIRRGAGRRLIRVEQQRRLSIDYPPPKVLPHEISAASDEYDEEAQEEEEEEEEELDLNGEGRAEGSGGGR